MYHGRFKNTHYQAGFHWGEMLRKHGNFIHKQHTFQITEERKKFAMECMPVYEKYYPESTASCVSMIERPEQIPYGL